MRFCKIETLTRRVSGHLLRLRPIGLALRVAVAAASPRGRGGIRPYRIRPCEQLDRRVLKSFIKVSRYRAALDRFFNVLRLETFGTLSDVEFHAVAFFQSLVPVAND